MSKLFESMSQKMRDLPEIKEFQEMVNSVRKEHSTKQAGDHFDSALICLVNVWNKLDIQLENPLTELRVFHINVKTEVTRL
ncbi:MAG: hypothetical protein O7157_03530 [Wolbachia endosymbiont of Tetragnatha montana]|nr:hypothetical protein [Wolbachia endosymbiont of Tetragnatha montana]